MILEIKFLSVLKSNPLVLIFFNESDGGRFLQNEEKLHMILKTYLNKFIIYLL